MLNFNYNKKQRDVIEVKEETKSKSSEKPLSYKEVIQITQDIKLLNDNELREVFLMMEKYSDLEDENVIITLNKLPVKLSREVYKYIQSKLPTE